MHIHILGLLYTCSMRLKKEVRQVNQNFFKKEEYRDYQHMHKSTGDKIGIMDGWVI